MRLRFKNMVKFFLFTLSIMTSSPQGIYANLPNKPVGFVAEVVGKVNKLGHGKPLKVKSPLFTGDRLETSLSALKAFFIDNSLIYMGPETFFRINSFVSMETKSLFRLYKGVVRVASYHQKSSVNSLLRTSALDVEYKGSDFLVRVFPYKNYFRTQIIVFRGKVKLNLFSEMGRKPFVLKHKESMVFYHNGTGNLLRAPMKGMIPRKVFKLLLTPRVDGGKLFLYELASFFKKRRQVSVGRLPASDRLSGKEFQKRGFEVGSFLYSAKDLQKQGKPGKVDPLEASIKEMERVLKQDEFHKRNRPLN